MIVERPEGSSSSSPANTAAAAVSTTPAPPGPPPLHSLHQKLSLPPRNPSPCSISIGNHRSPKTTLGLWWFPIEIEQGGGFTGGRESFWWREWRGGGPGGAGMAGSVAAAAVAGDGEEGLPPMIAGCGGAMKVACGCLRARIGSGASLYTATRSVSGVWISSSANRLPVASGRRGNDGS